MQEEPYMDEYDDRADVAREGEFEAAVEDGFETAHDVPPDALDWRYLPNTNDRDLLVAWLDSYQDGQMEQGFEGLLPEEYRRLIEEAIAGYSPEPTTHYPAFGG